MLQLCILVVPEGNICTYLVKERYYPENGRVEKLHNEEFRNLYYSAISIIIIIKSRQMK